MPPRTVRLLLTLTLCSATLATPAAHAQPGTTPVAVAIRGANSASFQIKFDGIDGEIMSPRDAASGLATGKRQHKPILAKTALSVLEEFQVIVANPPAAKTSTVSMTLSADGGGTCKAKVPTTYDASNKRFEIAIGDAARFFDEAKRPRPDLCPTR